MEEGERAISGHVAGSVFGFLVFGGLSEGRDNGTVDQGSEMWGLMVKSAGGRLDLEMRDNGTFYWDIIAGGGVVDFAR